MDLRLAAAALFVTALSWPSAILAQDYYSAVRPILVESCMGCHSESGVAWSMEDAEETFAERR
ncbi:MAG: hypothetical protein R3253_04680, partial [Longimicrobiales bacterium]|nr:hypothetical protein [Longimicrobiales bacterium]